MGSKLKKAAMFMPVGVAAFAMVAVLGVSAATTTVEPTNFNTHSDEDYKGVSVGFKVTSDEPLDSVKVELLKGDDVLVTNTGTQELLDLYDQSIGYEFTSPFVTYHGTYDAADDTVWQFGEWSDMVTPDTARITVNGEVVQNTTLTEPNGWTFETLLPIVNGENFNTHDDADYSGVNAGFNTDGFAELNSVEVSLLDAGGNVIVTNVGTQELFDLYADGINQFSTPFILEDLTYDADSDIYWEFGEWSSFATPVTAVVSVNGQEVEITPLTEADGVTFESIAPQAPTSKTACRNGGWVGFFKNQGLCVASFQSNENSRHNRQ